MISQQHLFQQRGELNLAIGAARLHVGQHALQIADSRGERLHFAQPLVNLLEPVGHHSKRFAKPRLERRLQLLFDRFTHLVELALVTLLQVGELRLQCATHFTEVQLYPPRQIRQLLPLQAGQSGHLLHKAGLQLVQPRSGFETYLARGRVDGGAQLALQPFVVVQ